MKGLDFNVWVSKKNKSGFRLKLRVGMEMNWRRVSVRYIASTSSNFIVGAFESTN